MREQDILILILMRTTGYILEGGDWRSSLGLSGVGALSPLERA
ncbi:hypothetical protein RIB2604_04300890 [Aspergillus luchuensis]|uniref:Uncharacterized protein n=1 Tax=Aspergillus kawachii TaxID=1069201 RepID=A0A146G1H7_ASPKA|nr:hypothetical protein RIB2604_04300890 [Aspergillus luchuensis]